MLHVPNEGRVLGLGCGTGELAIAVAGRGMRVVGCHITVNMLARATSFDVSRTVNLIQLDPGWQKLPLRPGTFDAVVASSVLEYVNQPAAVLGECHRLSRPGGTVISTVPVLRHLMRWLEWMAKFAARLMPADLAGRWTRLAAYVTFLLVIFHRQHDTVEVG
jgi:ubiquinone/menaquinone biosynthesis C-methylase UbiE